MKCNETGVLPQSEVYFSSPSQTAKRLYFYPISAGHFFCDGSYHLVRENYNSLLITHIIDGTFTYIKDGKHTTAERATPSYSIAISRTNTIQRKALNRFGFILREQTPTIYMRKSKKTTAIL